MNWTALGGTENESATANRLFKRFQFSITGQKHIRVTVSRARVCPATNLDGLDSQVFEIVQGFFQRFICQQNGKNSYFHESSNFYLEITSAMK
jgi:hypothetical protein